MKVLLKEDVDNLGYAGEVHNVANGYGRNYLLPRGLAVLATDGVLKQAAAWRERAEARRAEQRAEFGALTDKITGMHLVFRAKAGETGRLYGSVTMMDVADRLNEELGTDIDRRKFDSQPLRDLGEHQITIHLDRDFHPQLTIHVHPEAGETDESDAEETEVELAEADDRATDALTDVEDTEVEVIAEAMESEDDHSELSSVESEDNAALDDLETPSDE